MLNQIMRALTPMEEEKLNEALLNAFDADSFERMLRFKLGKNLDHFVSPNEGFRTVVFEIVKSANREGWLNDLIEGAAAANPGNTQLEDFVDSVTDAADDGDEDVRPDSGEYSAKELRRMLTGPYGLTMDELETVCFELDIEFDNLEGGRDARVLGLIQLLSRRGKLAALIDVLKSTYPHTLEVIE